MLSANLWVEVGLVNGALGTVEAICYDDNQQPPDLPIAVMVKFDTYAGPTLPDGTVPIAPLHRTWFTTTKQSPGATQARLGSDHTQVPGSDIGQGCH